MKDDHVNRLLPCNDGNGATIRGNDTRLRFREMVENLLPRPMLRHKPLRCSVRGPSPILPLHRFQQPLPNEFPVHSRRHAPKNHRLSGADHLGEREQERVFGVDNNTILHIDTPKHVGDGDSLTERNVRGVLRELNGPNCGPSVHHMVHLDALHVRVQRR